MLYFSCTDLQVSVLLSCSYIHPDQKVYCCTISDNFLFEYSFHRMDDIRISYIPYIWTYKFWQVQLPGCHNPHPVCRFLQSGSLPVVWNERSQHSYLNTVQERSRYVRNHSQYLLAASSILFEKDNFGLRSVPTSEYSDNKNQYLRKLRYIHRLLQTLYA